MSRRLCGRELPSQNVTREVIQHCGNIIPTVSRSVFLIHCSWVGLRSTPTRYFAICSGAVIVSIPEDGPATPKSDH
jgi:hypothetical protein